MWLGDRMRNYIFVIMTVGLLIALVCIGLGAVLYATTVPKEVVEIEVIKEASPTGLVHKWVDPDNRVIVYIWPKEYTGQVLPMYSTVPPIWYSELMRLIIGLNNGEIPQSVLEGIPIECRESIAPGSTKGSLELDRFP